MFKSEIQSPIQNIIAISIEELKQWGCPYCGYRSGYSPMSGNGTVNWICGDCNKLSLGLAEGLIKSICGFSNGESERFYPILQDHPFKGIKPHGNKDEKPENGEYLSLRYNGSIGLDYTNGCFICGKSKNDYTNNISGFVKCKASGERILRMSPDKGVKLDYRKHEPDYVQIKIGACDNHKENLKMLAKNIIERGSVVIEEDFEDFSCVEYFNSDFIN